MDATHYSNNSDNTIQKNLANGWDFKFGDYISNGFKNTNSLIGGNLAFGVLAFLIIMAVGFVPIAGSIVNFLFLNNCLLVGFAMAVYTFKKNGDTNFNNFWDGFKFIGPMATFGLVYLAIAIVIALIAVAVFGFSMIEGFMQLQKNPGNTELAREFAMTIFSKMGIFFLLIIGVFLALYPISFVPFFIVFHKKNAIDSITTSYKLLGKNYLIGFLFMVIVGIIAVLGVIACFVGLIYTFPATRNMLYELYADMTGLEIEDNTDANGLTDVNTLD